MRAAVRVALVLLSPLNLSACPQSNVNNPPDPGPPPASAPKIDSGHVGELCGLVDGFHDSRSARSDIRIRAEMSGIPKALRDKAKTFADAPTDGNRVLVIWECGNAGWRK